MSDTAKKVETRTAAEKPLRYFQLLAGGHVEPDWTAPLPEPTEGVPHPKRPSKTFKVGDVIPSPNDLAKKHGGDKYREVSGPRKRKGDAPAAASKLPEADEPGALPEAPAELSGREATLAQYGDLEAMHVSELKEVAKDLGVDLTGVSKKADIIEKLEKWRDSESEESGDEESTDE